jgi:hypothetical protein
MCVFAAGLAATSLANIPAGPFSGGDGDGIRRPTCSIDLRSTVLSGTASLVRRDCEAQLLPRQASCYDPVARVSEFGPDDSREADYWRSNRVGPVSGFAAVSAASAPTSVVGPLALDAYVRRYAAAYQVDYLLVAAMIRHESNWQSAVVSNRGAIGLMQLMPETAAMLGVNPNDPVENLRGGIAYLAGLLKTYKDARLALIAYNAGPDHANKVVRGEADVYPETRRYLDTINATYTLPGPREH